MKLARAILKGGASGLDEALAAFFTQHYGDPRDARGDKLATAPSPNAKGSFRLSKAQVDPARAKALPTPGSFEAILPVVPGQATYEHHGRTYRAADHGAFHFTW